MPWNSRRPIPGRPIFQQRHYRALARILAEQVKRRGLFDRAELSELVDNLITELQADNPSFKPDVFRRAVWRDGV